MPREAAEENEAPEATGMYTSLYLTNESLIGEVRAGNAISGKEGHIDQSQVVEAFRSLEFHPPVEGPVGGSLKRHAQNWQCITRDPWVLQAVQGCPIEWIEQPVQLTEPRAPEFRENDHKV